MTKTVSINQTVLDFLDYYTSAERKLDYAVLLDGPWGTGKTHLVRAFLEAHKARGGKHLYVSLYGMTSTNQIEDEFYRLLHPMLSSKGMRMAGTIIRGAAKGLLKIDFGGKSASESVTLAVPEINFADYLGGPGEHLLVFDDLERCAMPVSDLLGYINAFVEQDGMKVILIGNESEVIKGDKCFPLIKEKLIGQTLRVRSDVAAAYPDFLRQIAEGKVRGLLAAQREHVLTIHAQSKTNNLRLLKQSMWDFERLSKHISDEYWKNSKAIRPYRWRCERAESDPSTSRNSLTLAFPDIYDGSRTRLPALTRSSSSAIRMCRSLTRCSERMCSAESSSRA
jgi:hypothetical protein